MNQKKARIYYFSGTGNTELISELFRREFKNQDVQMEIMAIEEVLKGKTQLGVKDYDFLGFGHPVHAFSAPRIFFEFIKTLPSVEDIPSFYFRTAGDPICNGGATTMVRKILQNKGYKVFHESLLVMPANVAFQYDDELVKQLYNTAKKKIIVNIFKIRERNLVLTNNYYLFIGIIDFFIIIYFLFLESVIRERCHKHIVLNFSHEDFLSP